MATGNFGTSLFFFPLPPSARVVRSGDPVDPRLFGVVTILAFNLAPAWGSSRVAARRRHRQRRPPLLVHHQRHPLFLGGEMFILIFGLKCSGCRGPAGMDITETPAWTGEFTATWSSTPSCPPSGCSLRRSHVDAGPCAQHGDHAGRGTTSGWRGRKGLSKPAHHAGLRRPNAVLRTSPASPCRWASSSAAPILIEYVFTTRESATCCCRRWKTRTTR